MGKQYLFLTLNTFSATGGIEKVCRAAGKALYEIAKEEDDKFTVYSMYDNKEEIDERYFPGSVFKAFGGRKLSFAISALLKQRKPDIVLLSHINLLPVGFAIKKLSPKTKLVLIAHGIEVWAKLSGLKSRMLQSVDLFLPVSQYTGKMLQSVQGINAGKIQVLNNCLDPFLKNEENIEFQRKLLAKYKLSKENQILLTVTRLKHSEQYKGYDKVVTSLSTLKEKLPNLKYLIVGKYDLEEKARLNVIIEKEGLQDAVIFAGFVKDEELQAHFQLADAYIMPSTGEGFGIVFIEALYYGLPVIAGNKDGSVDALGGGEFGLLVDPTNEKEIMHAVHRVLENKCASIPEHQKILKRFGFETYKTNLKELFFYLVGVKKSKKRPAQKIPGISS
ncbi:MAG TPA: glycosyltransferase family 4 protein [Flavisolibacter sp.]|nr:glycosyltransferase family 4 protein [Flavisolibacter sp.]